MSSTLGRSAFHNPQRYLGRVGDEIHRLHFGAKTGHYELNTIVNGVKNSTPLPSSTLLVPDWGAFEIGIVRFSPLPYDENFVIYGQSIDMPSNPEGWQDAIRVPVLVQKLGLLSQQISAVIVINAFKALFDQFGYRTEAQQGLLAVYSQRESREIKLPSRPGEIFFAPTLEISEWMERDSDVFGPRRVDAPMPFIASTPPAITPISPPADSTLNTRPATKAPETYHPIKLIRRASDF